MLSRFQLRQVAEPRGGERTTSAPEDRGDRGLVVSGVSKRLRGQERDVLDGVNLTVAPGRAASISGANGAGKTTFLRTLAGLIRPDRGSIRLGGLDSERDARRYRARVGLLSGGDSGLFARLSVDRHLEYVARVALLSSDEGARAAERMRDAFELQELRSRRVDRLSLGQRQRVRAALALLHSPDLLLLDEPHTSLDAEGVALLRASLDAATARGATVLSCSPVGSMEGGVFDERYLMRDGRLRRL